MGLGEALKEAQFGTPVCNVIIKMGTRKTLFQIYSSGFGLEMIEKYGVAIRVARGFTESTVWHYTDRGNLVYGIGVNTNKLFVKEFTIVVDDNLGFLNMMCPCESARVAVRKFFAVGVSMGPVMPDGSTPIVLGDIHE